MSTRAFWTSILIVGLAAFGYWFYMGFLADPGTIGPPPF
jgi:hypothetical protein